MFSLAQHVIYFCVGRRGREKTKKNRSFLTIFVLRIIWFKKIKFGAVDCVMTDEVDIICIVSIIKSSLL